MTRNELAEILYASLVEDSRRDGEKFIRCAYDSPPWTNEAVREAHGEMMPDDMRYRMIRDVAGALCNVDAENWDDWMHETLDGLVDVYNHDRVEWLASSLHRAWYCDQAVSEYGSCVGGIYQLIGMGQLLEYEEIAEALRSCIERQLEDTSDDEDSE